MAATNRRPPDLPTEAEMKQAREASRELARLLPRGKHLKLVTDDNQNEMISLPPGALRPLVDILVQLGKGNAVALVPQRAELTTQQVADHLNVSRPHVVHLIESGKLQAHKVGTHRRVAFADLLAFDANEQQRRRKALDELHALDRELSL